MIIGFDNVGVIGELDKVKCWCFRENSVIEVGLKENGKQILTILLVIFAAHYEVMKRWSSNKREFGSLF